MKSDVCPQLEVHFYLTVKFQRWNLCKNEKYKIVSNGFCLILVEFYIKQVEKPMCIQHDDGVFVEPPVHPRE